MSVLLLFIITNRHFSILSLLPKLFIHACTNRQLCINMQYSNTVKWIQSAVKKLVNVSYSKAVFLSNPSTSFVPVKITPYVLSRYTLGEKTSVHAGSSPGYHQLIYPGMWHPSSMYKFILLSLFPSNLQHLPSSFTHFCLSSTVHLKLNNFKDKIELPSVTAMLEYCFNFNPFPGLSKLKWIQANGSGIH